MNALWMWLPWGLVPNALGEAKWVIKVKRIIIHLSAVIPENFGAFARQRLQIPFPPPQFHLPQDGPCWFKSRNMHSVWLVMSLWCAREGGYSIYPWVGRCGAAPHTLTLFKTNIADFPTLFKTEFQFLIPCLRHLSCLKQKLINRYPD